MGVPALKLTCEGVFLHLPSWAYSCYPWSESLNSPHDFVTFYFCLMPNAPSLPWMLMRLELKSAHVGVSKSLIMPHVFSHLQSEGEDELKKRQLMELAIINGTYRDSQSKNSSRKLSWTFMLLFVWRNASPFFETSEYIWKRLLSSEGFANSRAQLFPLKELISKSDCNLPNIMNFMTKIVKSTLCE